MPPSLVRASSSSSHVQQSTSDYRQPCPPHHGVYNDHPSPLQRSFSSSSSHHSASSSFANAHGYPAKAPHQQHVPVAPELVRLPSTASSTYSLPDPTTFGNPPNYQYGGGSAVSSGVSSASSGGWTSRNTTSRASGSVRDSATSSSFGEYSPYGNTSAGTSEKRHQRTGSFIVGGEEHDLEEESDEEGHDQGQPSAHPRHQPPTRPLREVHQRSYQYQHQQQQPNPSTSYSASATSYSGRHAPHASYSSQVPSPTASTSHSRIGLGITSDTAIHLPPDNNSSPVDHHPTNGHRWSDAYAGSSHSHSSVASGYGQVLGKHAEPRRGSNEDERDLEDSQSETSDSESESSGYGWAGEGRGSVEGAAVAMAEDGRGKIVRGEGLDLQRGPRLASELIGSTHLLLGSTPTPYLMPTFLETVLPSLVSTLVVLDISSCNLTSLPHEVSNLYVLEELNVSNNPLGSLPASLSQLHSLRVLSANEIQCSNLPASFASLQSLHTLCLRRNRLLSLPGWLSLLPNMETLLVEDNPFAGVWQQLVEHMFVSWGGGQDPMEQHAPLLSPGGTTSTGGGSTPITDSFYLADISPPVAPSPSFIVPSSASSSQTGFPSFPSPTDSTSPHSHSAPMSQQNSHNSYQPPSTVTSDSRSALLACRRPSLPYKQSHPTGGRATSDEPNGRRAPMPTQPPRLPEIPAEPRRRQPSDDGPVVRRMKSAGAMFHLGLGKDSSSSSASSSRPGSPTDGRPATPSFTSSAIGLGAPPPRMPPPKRFASMGRAGGSNIASSNVYRPGKGGDGIEELDGEDGKVVFPTSSSRPVTPADREVSGGKEKGKWGFLKKMSMGRIRSGSGSGSAIRPQPPIHSNTTPTLDGAHTIPRLPTRPSTSMGYSSGSFMNETSSANGLANELGQYGGPSTSSIASDATPQGMPSPSMLGTPTSRKNKRRSYLPLDMPPSLNIPIPSTSPFMSSTSTFSSQHQPYLPSAMDRSPKEDSDGEDDSASILESYLQQSPLDSPTMTFQPPPGEDITQNPAREAQIVAEGRRDQYLSGLRQVMRYLKDLHDLSLPANAGAPVDGPTGLDTPASQFSSAGSPMQSMSTTPTPSMGAKGRSRRPTTGDRPPELKREFSEGSMMLASPAGSSMGGPGPAEMGRAMSTTESGNSDESQEPEPRKYKEDKTKRAMVIREIIETERTYVSGLREVVELYVKPAEVLVNGIGSKETVVPLAERKVVFNGLSGLLQFHEESFLPKLIAAAKPLSNPALDDEAGTLSRAVAADVGDVFRTYNPFMRMYSTYINNFDNSLTRLKSWTAPTSSPYSTPGSPATSSATLATMGLSLTAASPPLTPDLSGSSALSSTQRKRVKTFLKRARQNPRHTQLNLESYLLLPVQRIPRYRMLLEDLLKCTPPRPEQNYDPLEDAFEEISTLASCMNEEKRDSESRRRLVQWQARIRGKFPSPLVQPHRKLLLDGALTLTRIVKKTTNYVEVTLPIIDDGDNTVTSTKSVVAIECLADPETLSTPLVGVLTSDLLVLCKTQPDASNGKVKVDERGLAKDGTVDLFAVLRMQTKTQPASITNGSTIRVVDNRAILYFEAPNTSAALVWLNAINVSFQVSRS